MWDVDGTNIGGFHFMGTGSYRFGSEDELQQYLKTTPNSVLQGKHVIEEGKDPHQKKDAKGR